MPAIRKSTVEEIRAIFVMEKFRNGNFCIAIFRDPQTGANVSVLGDMPEGELTAQIEYRLYGKKESNDRFGPQFRLATFVIAKPHSRTGVIRYLCKAGQGKGLGEATATALWNKFGADAVRILRESPEVAVAAADARGFSLEKAKAVAEQLSDWSSIEDCSIELIELLNGRGFPRDIARKAVKAWGNRAGEIIQRDPYKLMRFKGVGFLKTDAMYLDLGLPPEKLKRQAYAAAYVMASDSNGHIWHPIETAMKGIKAKISYDKCEPEKALSLAKRGKLLIERVDEGGQRWIAERSDAENEAFVAQHVANAMAEKPTWPGIEILDNGPSEHQLEQLSRALRGSIGLFCGSPGTGKAQPLDAKILTPHGWVCMGDIKVGDMVIGNNGKPIAVKAVFPQGMKDVYRVTMSDGASTECCGEHLWLTRTASDRRSYKKKQGKAIGRVRSLKEIAETLRYRNDERPNHEIPIVAPVEFNDASPLPVDPYVLGALLGDGSFRSGSIKFANVDDDILSEVKNRLPVAVSLHRDGNSHKDYRISKGFKNPAIPNPVLESIRDLGLYGTVSNSKFIPLVYLLSSINDRLLLLQGLLDTDGHCAKQYDPKYPLAAKSCSVEFSTVSSCMVRDICFLVCSLGGQSRVRSKIPTYTHNGTKKQGQLCFTVSIRLPVGMNPFRCARKLAGYVPATHNRSRRMIQAIEYVGQKECQCISVDSHNGLYVTDDFIVTHNTYTAAPLIRAIINQHGIGSIACAAPTGKASCRLTESLASYKVPLRATTIHSLLGVDTTPNNDDSRSGWSFKHGEYNPLPFKYVVIDESSMIDLSLMRSLLAARAKGTCILFIGDVNQLPPVGRGAPLRDFIEAGLPYGELTEIRRNAGTIVRACAAIRDNQPIPVDDVLSPSSVPPANLKIMPAVQAIAAKTVLGLVAKIRDQRLCDPIWDVQIIVAVNKRSPLCRTTLNKSLQAELNPAGKGIPGSPFRVGDKVIVLKNSTLPLADSQETCFVANGEFGCVIEVHEKRTIVDFKMPDRRVVIPRGNATPKEGDSNDDESGTGCDMDLGYAATCHKLQGSSAKIVIIALDEYPGATGQFGVCDKAWIYTAISRAEQICFLVGKRQTMTRMCNRTAIKNRKTFLVEDIAHYLRDFKIDFTPLPRVAIPVTQPALADLFA